MVECLSRNNPLFAFLEIKLSENGSGRAQIKQERTLLHDDLKTFLLQHSSQLQSMLAYLNEKSHC